MSGQPTVVGAVVAPVTKAAEVENESSDVSSVSSSSSSAPPSPVEASAVAKKSNALNSSSTADESVLPMRQLKKTCEACAKSKVKCEGSHPCARCSKRGVECIFLPEQKRGRRLGLGEELPPPRNVKRPSVGNGIRPLAPNGFPMHLHGPAGPISISNPHYQDQLRHLQQQHLQQQQKMMMANRGPMVIPQFVGPRFAFPSMMDPTATNGAPSPMAWGSAGMVPQFAFPMITSMQPLVTQLPPGVMTSLNPTGTQMMQQPMIFNKPPAVAPVATAPPAPGVIPLTTPPSAAAAPVIDEKDKKALSVLERRLVRTIFALHKHKHKSVTIKDEIRSQWFETRFNTMWVNLSGRISAESEHQLTSWLFANRMRLDKSLALGPTSGRKPCPSFANVGRYARGQAQPSGMHMGTVRILSTGQVECSDEFVSMVGYSSGDFSFKTWPFGFLPWGAEVLAQIVNEDQDVYGYICAAAAATEAKKTGITSGIVQTELERPISLAHKNGLRLDCNLSCEIIESVTPDGALLVGVTLKFFLSPPEQVFLQTTTADVVGPWDQSGWMGPLLNWVDGSV